MAKKNKQVNTGNTPPAPQQQLKKSPASRPAGSSQQQTKRSSLVTPEGEFKPLGHLLVCGAITLIAWLFLSTCLNNQLTNWDDPGYLRDNPLIKDVSGEGIRNIFSLSNPVMGNYHPLTILTYAIEYSYVRLQPWLYHFDSLLFHIITSLLVYWLVMLLTRKPVAAIVSSLLFALHPMHVESFAWIAGRKDVVYGAFYVGAAIAYVYYLRTTKNKSLWYAGVLFLFVCSLLAKPVAVSLPLTLLLIDYFEQRPLTYKLLIEKIPYFAIAIAFGIKSMLDQRTFGALGTQSIEYNFVERIALGAYALITYLWKAIVPVGLANFYPYPVKEDVHSLPYSYYGYVVALLAIVAVFVWLYKSNKLNRVIIFGLLFFLANIALLLQFIPVGGAILADRYSYIPYLGLFFVAGWYVAEYFQPKSSSSTGKLAVGISVVYLLALGYLANERCKVWYDTASLWRDEIEKQPLKAPNAYNNLGFNYFNKFSESVNPQEKKIYYDSAFYLLNKAIELDPTFSNPYVSLGELQRTAGNFPVAKTLYYKALSLKGGDENANAYLGLAIIYAISHNFDSAGICFRQALKLKPNFPEAQGNYGNFLDMTGKHDSALIQYGIAIQQNPDMYAPLLNRGRALQRMHRCDEAMKDFETALQLSPDLGDIYYARSYCYTQKGDKRRALQDVEKAISLGFTQLDPAYYQMLKSQ